MNKNLYNKYQGVPQVIRKHEQCKSLRECNSVALLLLSQILRLEGIETWVTDGVNLLDIFNNLLDDCKSKNKITEEQYHYIKKDITNYPIHKDRLINQNMSIDDIDQEYKSKEHGIHFCHKLPHGDTSLKNCYFGKSYYNGIQNNLSKFQILFLHLEAQLPEPQSSIEVGQLTCDDERFILVDTIIKEDYKFKQFFDDFKALTSQQKSEKFMYYRSRLINLCK